MSENQLAVMGVLLVALWIALSKILRSYLLIREEVKNDMKAKKTKSTKTKKAVKKSTFKKSK